MKTRLKGTDVVGLDYAKEAFDELTRALELLHDLPRGLFSMRDPFGPKEVDRSRTDWRDGLRAVTQDGFRDKLAAMHNSVVRGQRLLESVWVEFYTLLDDGTWHQRQWHDKGGLCLIKNVVEALNDIERARRLQSNWNWETAPMDRGDAGSWRHSRDGIAHHVAYSLQQLDGELDRHLSELADVSRDARTVKERNASTRERVAESASLKRSHVNAGVEQVVAPPSGRAAIEQDGTDPHENIGRMKARSWDEVTVVIKSETYSISVGERGVRQPNLRARSRAASALIQIGYGQKLDSAGPIVLQGESGRGKPIQPAKLASAVKDWLRAHVDAPGEPMDSVGNGGKYIVHFRAKIVD